MTDLFVTGHVWRFALAAIPLALVVALISRVLPCRPSTRHAMWLALLGLLVIAPLLPPSPMPDLVRLAEPSGGADLTTEPALPVRASVARPDRVVKDSSVASTDHRELATALPAPGSVVRRSPIGPPVDFTVPIARAVPRHVVDPTPRPPAQPLITRAMTARFDDAVPVSAPARLPVTPSLHESESRPGGPYRAIKIAPAPVPASVSAPASVPAPVSVSASVPASVPASVSTPLPAPAPARAETPSRWSAWVVQLGAIRDAVLALPPLPTTIWLGMAIAFVLVVSFRTVRFRRLLRRATPAPPDVQRTVEEIAASLDLRRIPATKFVPHRISPLVWCGRRVLLLLPADLWLQLDDAGRRAVICHELAHVRRRDHWVSWFAMLVGCFYWWHPVVWWIRRRLREEADLCCDAWVTALQPGSRRAYATALLETKKFTSLPEPEGIALGLGVRSLRARRFARRITMIMSHQRTPQLTITGVLLACAVAALGWLVAPTLACPPDELSAAPLPPAPPALAIPAHAPEAPHDAHPSDLTTFERYIEERDAGSRGGALEDRLEAMERRLDRMAELLEMRAAQMANAPRAPRAARAPRAPRAPSVTVFEHDDDECVPNAAPGRLRAMLDIERTVHPEGHVYWETYRLPAGRLGALTELMSRSDVPVLIRPGEDHIEVQGDASAHRIFRAFVVMIGGESDEVRPYVLPQGRLEALTDLMRRDDVPILIEIGDRDITMHGSTLEHRVFEAFVHLIAPELNPHENRRMGDASLPADVRALRAYENAVRGGERNAAIAEIAALRAAELEALHAELGHVEASMASTEALAEQLYRQAEQLEEQGDILEDEGDHLEDALDEASGPAEEQAIRARLERVMAEAKRAWDEAMHYETVAEEHEDESDALDDLADEIRERIEELQEMLEDLREAIGR